METQSYAGPRYRLAQVANTAMARRLSAAWVAATMGVGVETLDGWYDMPDGGPTWEHMARLAVALGLPADYYHAPHVVADRND